MRANDCAMSIDLPCMNTVQVQELIIELDSLRLLKTLLTFSTWAGPCLDCNFLAIKHRAYNTERVFRGVGVSTTLQI
jgi:hypothetical protein